MRAALAFLTVIPVGARCESPGRGALTAFPLVGLAVGAMWSGVAWMSTSVWEPFVAAAMVLAADLLITAGLHVDAVADVADAVASRRAGEEARAIMREATIGAVGAAALVIVLLLRFAFLAALASRGSWLVMMLPPVAGRAAMVWSLGRARRPQPSSIAASLSRSTAPEIVALAAMVAGGIGWFTGGIGGVAAVFVAVGSAEAWTRSFERKFDGLSGDGVGVSGIVGEIGALAVVAGSGVWA